MRSLTVVTAVGAGLVAGVFFAFSTFVMRAFEDLPPRDGLRAMQSVNRAAPSPLFMAALLGTAAACIGLGIWSLVDVDEPGAWYRVAGCAVYLVGIAVTIAYHIPRNDALAVVDADGGRGGRPLDRLRRRVDVVEPRPHAHEHGRRGPARHRVAGRVRATARLHGRDALGVSAGDGCCAAPPPARAVVGQGRRGRGPRRSPPGSG